MGQICADCAVARSMLPFHWLETTTRRKYRVNVSEMCSLTAWYEIWQAVKIKYVEINMDVRRRLKLIRLKTFTL